jgi:hypothetical protein
MRQQREGNHYRLCNAEVKNGGDIYTFTPAYVFMAFEDREQLQSTLRNTVVCIGLVVTKILVYNAICLIYLYLNSQ